MRQASVVNINWHFETFYENGHGMTYVVEVGDQADKPAYVITSRRGCDHVEACDG